MYSIITITTGSTITTIVAIATGSLWGSDCKYRLQHCYLSLCAYNFTNDTFRKPSLV